MHSGLENMTWVWWMREVLTPVIALVGIIGNCLSIVVMKSKSLRHKSYSHFLCALAIFDSLSLVGREIVVIEDLYPRIGKPGLFVNFDDAACKAYNFFEHVCYLMSSWLIVCMAIERVIAVCLPFKKTILRTNEGGIITIFILFVGVCATQIHRMFMVEHVNGGCIGRDADLNMYLILEIYFYLFTLIFVLPVVIVLVCNSLVLYQIYRIRRAARSEKSSSNRISRVIRRRHKTTIMMLMISFTYVITLAPSVVVPVVIYTVVRVNRGAGGSVVMALIPYRDLFEVVAAVNYGINFFIYVLSGKAFRCELRRVIFTERSGSVNGTRTREEYIRQ